MSTLTPKQQALLNFIKGYIAEHGVSPTNSEMGAAVGHKFKSTTAEMLTRLVNAGVIRRVPGKRRSVEAL